MHNDKEQLLGVLKKVRDVGVSSFITSHSLEKHPLSKAKTKLRARYYAALEYFVTSCSEDRIFIDARLAQYRSLLVGNYAVMKVTEKNRNNVVRSIVNDSLRPWRRKYRYLLFCDITLVLANEQSISQAEELMLGFLGHKQGELINGISEVLKNDEAIPITFAFAEDLIKQFRANRNFTAQTEKRFIVTANMSAGKSTLINALVGKPVVRTSQEACTANLCFLYSKPFEDNAVHFLASSLNLNAKSEDLARHERTEVSYIASFFRSLGKQQKRVCIIDTPGVNSAINCEHGKLTRKALREETYDFLIYVFNANRLGTDEELRHLRYVAETISNDKVIFVLNKLDDFNKQEDSIEESIDGIRNDLLSLGYDNPIICPLSAYFALLIKMKQNGEQLTEDENDEFEMYSKKFLKPEYDLSHYYGQMTVPVETVDELMALAVKCGLYGLENILYGGKQKE